MTKEQGELLQKWERTIGQACHAHYDAAVKADSLNRWIGVPVVLLTTTVGTGVVGTLNSSPALEWRLVAVGASLTAAVLASLQTFLRLSERGEKHRVAGARFGALLRELRARIAFPQETEEALEAWCMDFGNRWTALAQDSLTVPSRSWKKFDKSKSVPLS